MFPVEKIARTVQGELLHRENVTPPTRAIHDSRLVEPGDLFIALRGRRSDGHDFLSDAFRRGASAALVSDTNDLPPNARNIICVPDPVLALQQWATAWRQRLNATFIGITGTNGKTTVRALLGHLLQTHGHAYVSPYNYNTEIGLPMALLSMPMDADIGVFELGAENPGDIATLARILQPHMGIVTTLGPGHLDGFQTMDGVATEKWSLVEHLPENGTALINADVPRLLEMAATATINVLSVGLNHGDLRGHLLQSVPHLELTLAGHNEILRCPLVGEHNAINVLLASVAAHTLGVRWEVIAHRMASFVPIAHRLSPIQTSFGTILDDTYNANPASMRAALDVLATFGTEIPKRLFVFGDMLGLGTASERFHREVAQLALQLPIDVILPVGQAAIAACQAVAPASDSSKIVILPRNEVSSWIVAYSPAMVVLVKGSRGLALETLAAELQDF